MPESKNPLRERMAQVLCRGKLDAETVDIIIDVIASDAAFNTWVLWSEKENGSIEKLLSLADEYEEILGRCGRAVDAFIDDAAEFELRAALSNIVKSLKTVTTL